MTGADVRRLAGLWEQFGGLSPDFGATPDLENSPIYQFGSINDSLVGSANYVWDSIEATRVPALANAKCPGLYLNVLEMWLWRRWRPSSYW